MKPIVIPKKTIAKEVLIFCGTLVVVVIGGLMIDYQNDRDAFILCALLLAYPIRGLYFAYTWAMAVLKETPTDVNKKISLQEKERELQVKEADLIKDLTYIDEIVKTKAKELFAKYKKRDRDAYVKEEVNEEINKAAHELFQKWKSESQKRW